MRRHLKIAAVLGGIGAAIVLVLLILTAITRSIVVGAVTGVLGLLLLAGVLVMARKLMAAYVARADQLATRSKNLEHRTAALADRSAEADERVRALHARTAVLDTRADALESGAVTQGEGLSKVERQVVGLTDGSTALERQVADLTDGSSTFDRQLTTLSSELAAARGSGEATKERLQRVRKDVQVLRNRVPADYLEPVKTELRDLRTAGKEILRSTFESSVQLGRSPREAISPKQAGRLFNDYVRRQDYLKLRPLVEEFDLLDEQSLTTLRALYKSFRSAGHWDLAARAVATVHKKSGRDNDELAMHKIRHEIEVFSNPTLVTTELPDGEAYDPSGPILHMVGRVLPETQTGYTLRTQYTAQAQARKGLPVAIVGQAGITEEPVESITHYSHQGIDYYLLPGPAKNLVLIDEWLRLNMTALAELVQQVKPSVLHAQSDFFNELIVNVVGKRYGIPTVYESRGFWEESWLSRTITANGWEDTDTLFSMYGIPAAYELRKHAEEVARLLPDHVFTLAEVMKDHILDSADGKIPETAVSIVPNAVESANFPVQEADKELAAEVGLSEDAVVIGYISSIVEYEGIDTLIDAYHQLRASTDRPVCLLLVGDGDYLTTLRQHVEDAGIEDVHFTGRVAHEDVLRYYGLIDVFVVPRKKSAVADLVTPLKPFEAFSTGRAVVLSDVGALQEIADQSQSVETFRAGDSADLAQVLERLVEDPRRRSELSANAAHWVRNHRSWDGNVNEYYRVYRELGFAGPENLLIDAELALTRRGANPGELLEKLRSAELPATKGWFTIQDIRQSAESILETGWKFASFDPVPVGRIENWAWYGEEHRSWGFHLHAWEFMDPLIRAFDETGEVRWLEEAVRIALGWISIHRQASDDDDPMAWYDMSQSLRTPRLIALTLRAARTEGMRERTTILADALAWHFEELHQDRAFNPNNNHGFYTAVSQVHAAKYAPMLPDSSQTAGEGRERLARMATAQFAADGVHLEHSPDYHRMLLNSFELAVQDGLIEDEEVKGRVERAAHVLGWMIQPDGTLVQFGDSPETKIVRPDSVSIDPQTQYLLSNGEKGERPTDELAVYHDGGYAFVRSPQPDGPDTLRDSGYLAFSAAFHSRAHKHADDLNVVWFDRGQQILTDGGRFGYGDLLPIDSPLRREGFYYAAPERQYVEGTMAHNTLMMDGANQERRTRDPYGSGMGECGVTDGVFDLSARVHHADYIHRRRVVYRPGHELLLKDSVFSQAAETREGTLWLNVSGHFELESADGEVVFVSETDRGLTRLRITNPGTLITPVRGQEEPMRGWRSRLDRSLEPTWSIGFVIPIDTRASVDTRLTLD